jgi:hypothetical protein
MEKYNTLCVSIHPFIFRYVFGGYPARSVFMKVLLCVFLFAVTVATKAQVVSRFTWSSLPLTTADVGPNGTSVSTSAYSSFIGGSLGYAINPGLPTMNVDLVVPGSPVFDLAGMDLDLYFRREENVASFFRRGSAFNFGINGGFLYVTFTTTQGSTPGDITINSGNIVTIADDHAFHHYRFFYDNNTGVANVYVDGVVVYTYNGVAGRPLSWTGAGNVVIGADMDATSRDIPRFAYSNVVKINHRPVPGNACFPNPARDFVYVEMKNAVSGTYLYSVMNLQGHVLKSGMVTVRNGSPQTRIDLSGPLPVGALILRIHNKEQQSFRIVKSN